MGWTEILLREIDDSYKATIGLMKMVDADMLDWRPESAAAEGHTGWMTTGELMGHLSSACGWCSERFLKNDWDQNLQGGGATQVESVESAIAAVEADKEVAITTVREYGEERLANEEISAPWGVKGPAGKLLLDNVNHLNQHKSQLFYYLKIRGKPVHTGDLWGLG